ncbi:MAG: methionine adenosyltransferase [Actinobacteria bacterium]|uniref:methionine adenosyltransferase n=1 Tax=freshwater metagenome TaxID=449393 RepID=A0A6J6FU77_9ZZZZ|nr:methionine adenosyltransferase [Actinomycetota bacterium]
MSIRLFTSESVTSGHPDKLCDQLSDAILDAILVQDRNAKVAVECLASGGLIHVAGEIRTESYVDIDSIVRGVILGIGYDSSDVDFDGKTCGVMISIADQSSEINTAVEKDEQGAGDQGIMFGYATNETPSYMPAAIFLAHRVAEQLEMARKAGTLAYLRPDGKTQVTVGYEGMTPTTIDTVLVSTQHAPNVDGKPLTQERIAADVREFVIDPVIQESGLDISAVRYIVNPSGSFEHGGPGSDAGLTGRKIIVDTYGGAARHGGGAFSGKDPSKVDRSGAYAMRWVAKNAVAAGLADRLEVQVAYAIGMAEPIGLYVEAFGTEKVELPLIETILGEVFDLRPGAIIRDLELLTRQYLPTATYGHFGRTGDSFTWERLDRVEDIRESLARHR